jgi:hypothetical protein
MVVDLPVFYTPRIYGSVVVIIVFPSADYAKKLKKVDYLFYSVPFVTGIATKNGQQTWH